MEFSCLPEILRASPRQRGRLTADGDLRARFGASARERAAELRPDWIAAIWGDLYDQVIGSR